MIVLLDSHVFIWLLYKPARISAPTIALLQAADMVYISTVSLWELAIKYSKGKLAYAPEELQKGVAILNAKLLPLSATHVSALPDINLPHSDPFDAMLLAQSVAEGCSFLTADRAILQSNYNVTDVTK